MKSQCFAYSEMGKRCDKTAGHAGLHAVNISWSDEECFTPNTRAIKLPTMAYGTNTAEFTDSPTPMSQPNHLSESGFEVKAKSERKPSEDPCAACNHRHRNGECKCGCHTHIG